MKLYVLSPKLQVKTTVNKPWALGQMQPVTCFSTTLRMQSGFHVSEVLKKI